MSNARYYIEIKNTKIPVIVRNYKKSNNLKLFFSGDVLNISKPKWYSIQKVKKEYGEYILKEYKKVTSQDYEYIKHFKDGDKLLYKGKEYTINRKIDVVKKISITINEENQNIYILIPDIMINEDEIRKRIQSCIKNIFKVNTYMVIQEKLDYWKGIMNLEYTSFKINDTKSKYGSCMPKQKKLFFSLRLIMLPDRIIDAIVVHELSHILQPNHSNDFYNLVKKYIPNYDECDKWLKNNLHLLNL